MSDFIKREDAMELINKCVSHTLPKAKVTDFRHGEINGLNWACDIIEAMPSADVAPVRHGRWEKNDDYTCSLCGYRMVIGDGAYNYCPNCGAKMDGEEKNCDTCKHHDKGWDDIICDGCTKAHSNWERKDDE